MHEDNQSSLSNDIKCVYRDVSAEHCVEYYTAFCSSLVSYRESNKGSGLDIPCPPVQLMSFPCGPVGYTMPPHQ